MNTVAPEQVTPPQAVVSAEASTQSNEATKPTSIQENKSVPVEITKPTDPNQMDCGEVTQSAKASDVVMPESSQAVVSEPVKPSQVVAKSDEAVPKCSESATVSSKKRSRSRSRERDRLRSPERLPKSSPERCASEIRPRSRSPQRPSAAILA